MALVWAVWAMAWGDLEDSTEDSDMGDLVTEVLAMVVLAMVVLDMADLDMEA